MSRDPTPENRVQGLTPPAVLTWLAGFCLIVLVHLIWVLLNNNPPVWDMALHQEQGWRFARAWQEGQLWSRLAELSSYYPPLYYILEAALIRLGLGAGALALGCNLAGMALLSWFTFRLGALWLSRSAALAAGWISLLFPIIVWTSRESLLDVTLAGLVAWTLYLVARRNLNESGGRAVLLGLVLAAGQLTKWTFVFFVAGPVLAAVIRSTDWRRSLRNLLTAALVATPPVFSWMLPNLHVLLGQRLELAVDINVAREAPGLLTAASLLYYPRSFLGYYYFLPAALFLVVGWWRNRPAPRLGPAWVAVASVLVALTLSFVKDPRYAIPLAAPLALLLVGPWQHHKRVLRTLVAIAAIQALVVSFALTPPFRLSLGGREPDPDYLNITHEWVLLSSDYYGVMGPPGRSRWPLAELVEALPPHSRVGFVPDRARLHPGLLTLASTRGRLELDVYRVGRGNGWLRNLRESDWLVGATGPQGISYLTTYNEDVYREVERAGWPLTREWDLPDGTRLRLWRNPSRSR